MKKKIVLGFLFFLFFFLSACGGNSQNTLSYKRRIAYTSVSEVLDLEGQVTPDMTLDQTLKALNTWSEAKYELWTAGQTPPDDAKQTEILIIPYGKIGVLRYGALQILLPARAYPQIPSEDDEIQVVDALNVQPGQIAWRYDVNGNRLTLPAKEVVYDMPNTGWTVEAALRVNPGQIAWRVAPDGTIQKLTTAQPYPSEIGSDWIVENYLSVKPGQMAFRLNNAGDYDFKSPGQYSNEIESEWTIATAVLINNNSFGIYFAQDGQATFLASGWHYDVLPEAVNVYPSTVARYRTLSPGLLAENPNPDDPACSSLHCDTSITSIVIAGTDTTATFDVDILFRFQPNADPNLYANIGDALRALQDYIATPARNSFRIDCSDMNRDDLRTAVGQTLCENVVLAALQKATEGTPIIVERVSIRSKNFNDAALVAASEEAELARQEAQNRIDQANLDLLALQAEQALREAQQLVDADQFATDLDRQIAVLQAVADSGLDWQTLAILYANDLLDLDALLESEYGLQPDVQIVVPNN